LNEHLKKNNNIVLFARQSECWSDQGCANSKEINLLFVAHTYPNLLKPEVDLKKEISSIQQYIKILKLSDKEIEDCILKIRLIKEILPELKAEDLNEEYVEIISGIIGDSLFDINYIVPLLE
jgi:hypothetical protein